MIFAVFPLLSMGFTWPWFYRFSGVLNAVEKVLETAVFFNFLLQGIDLCHEKFKLVAQPCMSLIYFR